MTDNITDDVIRSVDLFCGAGGLSWGLVEALKRVAVEADQPTEAVLEECIDLVGVNHWEVAIETHERNHPWARHFHDDVSNVNPSEVFDDPDAEVTILSGGIECTHWSTARGGKPVDEQKRMPAFDFLTWVQKLRPKNVLVENVKEFEKWGAIEDDGTPSRSGDVFAEWVDSLHALGYSVDWKVLTAADYGDATSRERLFILARREHKPEFPEPTHSDTPDGDAEAWRTAADIIDWTEPGDSIWGRSRPLVNNTMQRIAEGVRRHGDGRLDPFADAMEDMDKADVEAMQERVVPAEYAAVVASVLDEPFLVAPSQPAAMDGGSDDDSPSAFVLPQSSNSVPRDVDDRPMPTITTTSRGISLCDPATFLLGQHGGGAPRPVSEQPVPTIATDGYVRLFGASTFVLPANGYYRGLHSNPAFTPEDEPLNTVKAKNTTGHVVTPAMLRFSHGGALLDTDAPLPTITTARGGVFALSSPYLVPFYGERPGQRPRTASLDAPYPAIPATGPQHGLATPYLIQYHGESGARSIDEPIPTLTAKDSLALCIPSLYPWGLDVRFRMLQPRELAAAQGFPPEYEFCGTKTETVEQIGNAVPVNLARNLVESLLESSMPTLTDFEGDGTAAATDSAATGGGAEADD